jgi:hypothetical protein
MTVSPFFSLNIVWGIATCLTRLGIGTDAFGAARAADAANREPADNNARRKTVRIRSNSPVFNRSRLRTLEGIEALTTGQLSLFDEPSRGTAAATFDYPKVNIAGGPQAIRKRMAVFT